MEPHEDDRTALLSPFPPLENGDTLLGHCTSFIYTLLRQQYLVFYHWKSTI